jgi:hypothetical protein
MKYFYSSNEDNTISLVNMNFEPTSKKYIEISQEKYNELNTKISQGMLLYLDEKNELQTRNKFTKWDENTKQWIDDNESINKHNNKKLINDALNLLCQTDDWGLFDRCNDSPDNHVNEAHNYRKQLRGIVRGTLNMNQLPTIPDFMKK